MSGVDSDQNARDFEQAMIKSSPYMADHVYACNDTLGTLYAASSKGELLWRVDKHNALKSSSYIYPSMARFSTISAYLVMLQL